MQLCMHACIFACVRACMYFCMRACVHVCMSVCVWAQWARNCRVLYLYGTAVASFASTLLQTPVCKILTRRPTHAQSPTQAADKAPELSSALCFFSASASSAFLASAASSALRAAIALSCIASSIFAFSAFSCSFCSR